jgi:hypothetical protein
MVSIETAVAEARTALGIDSILAAVRPNKEALVRCIKALQRRGGGGKPDANRWQRDRSYRRRRCRVRDCHVAVTGPNRAQL